MVLVSESSFIADSPRLKLLDLLEAIVELTMPCRLTFSSAWPFQPKVEEGHLAAVQLSPSQYGPLHIERVRSPSCLGTRGVPCYYAVLFICYIAVSDEFLWKLCIVKCKVSDAWVPCSLQSQWKRLGIHLKGIGKLPSIWRTVEGRLPWNT